MQKEFYPNIEFNRKRRRQLWTFYLLLLVLCGGFSVYMFATKQFMLGGILAAMIALLFSMVPSSLAQYPVKSKALIKIDGKQVTFYTGETVKASDILAVSISIDVPEVGKIAEENKKYLAEVASTKPTEPVFGACDVSVRNEKGKEVVKYHLIEDVIGALECFLSMGVKKYRILYCMKKLTEEAKYKMTATEDKENKLSDLTEKEKMMQLL